MLVTGAGRGFGYEITRQAVEAGYFVVATVRNAPDVSWGPSDEFVQVVQLDVRNTEAAAEVVAQLFEQHQRLDVLVNNAGFGLLGAVEETSLEQARAMMDVNFFGALNMMQQTLPIFRNQRQGRIINLSSGGGFAAAPGSGVYCATKFALEGVTEALRAETESFGIDYILVEPGSFRTDFLNEKSIQAAAEHIADYDSVLNRQLTDFDGKQPGDPRKASAEIVKLAQLKHPPFRLVLGAAALERIEGKLVAVAEELEQWRHVSNSMDY